MFGHEDYKYKSNDLESRFEHNSLGGEECKLLRNWAPREVGILARALNK